MFHNKLTGLDMKMLKDADKSNISTIELLRDNLNHSDPDGSNPVRYPLIVSRKGFASLNVLEEYQVMNCGGKKTVETIFGSSFAEDHHYTNVCRTINHIKLCLEAGKV